MTKEPTVGLAEVLANGDRLCRSAKCRRLIEKFDEAFLDELAGGGTLYCERCGTMLRFHRKRAIDRGEEPPLTFEHVDERMKR